MHYIVPGKPTQNTFVLRFNVRLRDRLLNESLFPFLRYTRFTLTAWQNGDNTETLMRFTAGRRLSRSQKPLPSQWRMTQRNPQGAAPVPVAQPAQNGKTQTQSLALTG